MAQKSELRVSHHFVFIEVPIGLVTSESLLWGEASWWPKPCPWHTQKLTEGDIAIGTQYHHSLGGGLAPRWVSEITQYEPRREIERTFKGDFFVGYEVIQVGERANGTRIDYEMHYQVKGLYKKILWEIYYRKKYEAKLEMILATLKEYVVKQYYKD